MIARKLVPPIVALGAGCMIALAWEGSGQGKEKQDRQKKIPPGAYYSSGSCYECHNKPQSYQDKFIPNICRCNEFEIWETTDKHRLAFLALKGKRADMMRERLGYDVRAAKACVSCHSVWIEDNQVREKQQSLVEEGVSCFVCHGPDSGTDKRWMDTHGSTNPATRDEWRKESRETKQTRYGMRDLWNPAERSRLCVSCHIGNADEDKIVTHEMYAAGHPPLPSFDMSNFSEAMKHWQALGEKSPAVLKEFKYSPLEVEREQLDLVTIGSLVSFQQTMVLLKKQASKLDAWPEFAQFDCYACHHDLKNPSWRQQRGYRGKPGRPQMSAWPTALMEVAVEYASGADAKAAKRNFKDFEAKLAKLQAASNAQPFGDTAKIADATDELVQFIRGIGDLCRVAKWLGIGGGLQFCEFRFKVFEIPFRCLRVGPGSILHSHLHERRGPGGHLRASRFAAIAALLSPTGILQIMVASVTIKLSKLRPGIEFACLFFKQDHRLLERDQASDRDKVQLLPFDFERAIFEFFQYGRRFFSQSLPVFHCLAEVRHVKTW